MVPSVAITPLDEPYCSYGQAKPNRLPSSQTLPGVLYAKKHSETGGGASKLYGIMVPTETPNFQEEDFLHSYSSVYLLYCNYLSSPK